LAAATRISVISACARRLANAAKGWKKLPKQSKTAKESNVLTGWERVICTHFRSNLLQIPTVLDFVLRAGDNDGAAF